MLKKDDLTPLYVLYNGGLLCGVKIICRNKTAVNKLGVKIKKGITPHKDRVTNGKNTYTLVILFDVEHEELDRKSVV